MKKKRGLVSCVQEFTKDAVLTPIFVVGEVAFDVLIPMMMAQLIDKGIDAGNLSNILRYGGLLVGMALVALVFGTGLHWLFPESAAGNVPQCPEFFLF